MGANSGAVAVNVSEPCLGTLSGIVCTSNLNKVVQTLPVPADAGGVVTYRITFANATGSNISTAFDTRVLDTLPASLQLNLGSVIVTLGAGAIGPTNASAGNTVDVTIATIPPGGTVQIDYTATILDAALAGDTVDNTANFTYTSLPGAGTPTGQPGNSAGSTTPGASGATNGERNGSGTAPNDYLGGDPASFTMNGPTIDKLAPTPAGYTIGEVVTYNILVTLPEGTTQNPVVFDDLPAGLQYVANSVQVLTSDGLLAADFNGTLPSFSVTAPGGSGDDVTVTFSGNATTVGDNLTNNNVFLVRLQARVLNVIGNQNGTVLTNNASVRYTDPESGVTTITDPTPPTVTVVEPVLKLTKQQVSVSPSPAGLGSVVTYRVTVAHDASSAATAYDVRITDALPVGLTLNLGTVAVTLNGAASGPTNSSAGNNVDVTVTTIPNDGSSVIVEYQATLNGSADLTNTNTADVLWSTLSDADPNERGEGDGVPDGNQLLGSGALNDYELQSSVSLAVDMDMGDLPAPYATLAANNGPRHLIMNGLQLGAAVDAEANGQPNPTATGDDLAGTPDEDGVTLPTFTVSQNATVVVMVTNTSGGSAILYGFIDFNGDGDFADANETLTTNVPNNTNGAVNLVFSVPANANTVQSLGARFRLSTAAGLGADGPAPNGEVEDYLVEINATAAIGDLVWWDVNKDGRRDAGEPGIPDVTVELYDSLGNLIGTDITDANGKYDFVSLAAGAYTVKIANAEFQLNGTLENWDASPQHAAGVPSDLDSDGNPTTHDASVTLPAGQGTADIDFGFTITASYTVAKAVTSLNPTRPDEQVKFSITIVNTGNSWISMLPMQDTYDTAYLTYGFGANFATPDTFNHDDDGVLNWTDLTAATPYGFGTDLAPGETKVVQINFTARGDTSALPNPHETVNAVTVANAVADPDGPSGPLPALAPLPTAQSSDGVAIYIPTGVTIEWFDAVVESGGVLVTWRTASETEIVGFNVLRQTTAATEFVKVNPQLLVAEHAGQNLGAAYAFRDTRLQPGGYTYRLEAVKLDGSAVPYQDGDRGAAVGAAGARLSPVASADLKIAWGWSRVIRCLHWATESPLRLMHMA